MLRVENVGKHFDSHAPRLLHDINLQLEAGQSGAIMGASGSGKSTLLNMIAGLSECSEGSITIDGTVISQLPEDERDAFRARHIGMVFQQFNLIDCLSVKDNILLPSRYLQVDSGASFASLLQTLGIAELVDHTIEHLSGGQQQRVAVARALLHAPKLILADEPTGNLDSHTSRQVADLLFALAKNSHTSLLIVTHSEEVAARADTIWRVKEGTLIQSP